MKTKFETNVAQEVPKTRMSNEPGLPWKLQPEDLEKATSAQEVYKSATTGAPPLKTRPIFLIMLLAAIFAAVMYFASLVMTDNENTRVNARKKELAAASLQATLEKINTQKNALSDNLGQLEKRVNELTAQKELFATVIESLTKKADEAPPQSVSEDKPAQIEASGAQQANQGSQTSQSAVQPQETKNVQ